MSTLHIKQLKAYFDTTYASFIDMSDSTGSAEQIKNQFYSKSLVLFSLTIELGLPVSELSDPVVDGFGDNGIDGVYYNSASSTLYLVQSKWHNDGNGSIDREGIQKFIKGA